MKEKQEKVGYIEGGKMMRARREGVVGRKGRDEKEGQNALHNAHREEGTLRRENKMGREQKRSKKGRNGSTCCRREESPQSPYEEANRISAWS